ncbi:nucleotidyltransferase family protein [Planctomycetota bacterium]
MAAQGFTREQVTTAIQEAKGGLLALGIKSIGLFGSVARGEATSKSDVDVLVEFNDEARTFDHFMDACFLLEDLLGRRVELVTKDSLSPYIKPHIMKDLHDVSLAG